jgi:hypothetical protein
LDLEHPVNPGSSTGGAEGTDVPHRPLWPWTESPTGGRPEATMGERDMKRSILIPLATALALAGPLSGLAWASKVSLEETPKPVQQTIHREVGKSTITEMDREKRSGRIEYEVQFTENDGTKYKMRVRDDGKLMTKKTKML